jgi:excisionase family DNA binding protein
MTSVVSVRVDLSREQMERITAFAGEKGLDIGTVIRAVVDAADLDGDADSTLPEAPVLTIPEVARFLRVHRTAVYRWIDEGMIPHRRITPKRVVIPRDAFMKWFDSGVAGGK